MAFLRGIKGKLDRIKNLAISEKLQVFNVPERLKYYKQRWKEHLECQIPNCPNKSGKT